MLKQFARALAAVVIASAVAGCAVDQKKEVETYRRELDATSPKPAAYDGDRALTLVDAMAMANQNNEQLSTSGEDYLQALIDKNRAVAAFLPTLSFRPSYTLEQTPRTNSLATATGATAGGTDSSGTGAGTGIGGTSGTTSGGSTLTASSASLVSSGFRRLNDNVAQQLQAPVVGSINVFRGGGDLATLRSAEQTIEQRRQLLLDTQATILLNVAQTYYAVLRSERSVEVLTNTLQVQTARLKDVEQQFKNGLATNLAVAQTRAQLDSTRASLVLAEGDVKNGRNTLGFLIGADRIGGPLQDDFSKPIAVQDEQAFEQIALKSRQDLLAAKAGVDAARERVSAAISQYYPSVTLNVEGFLYREYYADASKWSAILSLNLPIFSAGIIEADVRTAWSRLRQAALNESYVRRQALNDVRTVYQNLQTSDARVAALNDEVKAANDAFKQSKDAFNNNLAINLDVLTSQDQLLSSQLDLAGSEYDRTVYYLDLLRATGQLNVNRLISAIAAPTPATQPTSEPAIPR